MRAGGAAGLVLQILMKGPRVVSDACPFPLFLLEFPY